MGRNIFGEYTLTCAEIAQNLLDENTELYQVSHSIGTKQGFYLMNGSTQLSGVMKTGFYTLYKNDKPIYVGYSMNEKQGLSNRISRFVKEVLGNSNSKENHSAAKKYRFYYGTDFSDLKLSVMKYPKVHNITAKEIEKSLIKKLKPILNSKV
jgi:hypothetical protein